MLKEILIFIAFSSLAISLLAYTNSHKTVFEGATTPYYNESPDYYNHDSGHSSPYLPTMGKSDFLNYIFNKSFHIDDTNEIEQIRDELACVPAKFGYSIKQGQELFPPYKYPDCADVNKNLKDSVKLDIEKNELKLNCKNGKGRYITGPRDDRKLIIAEDIEFKVKKYPGHPVKLKGDEEYVLASCSDNGDFNLADMHPRFNSQAFNRSQEIGHRNGYLHGRPSLILHLVVDSFSRRHFYRKMPETVKLLNSASHNSTHAIFDFKIHNIHGYDSAENMVVTLSGIKKDPRTLEGSYYPDDLWNILSSQGYITMIGQENCNRRFAPTFGEHIPIDHSVNEFYCAAKLHSHYSSNKLEKNVHRCIGKKMSHSYLMDYTWEFMETYKELDKWMYIHLDAAHEGSGQHAATLDSELASFIERVMNRDEVVYIFLEGDHGMRYGDWKRSEEASYEWKLPVFFLIMPHETLQTINGSYNKLLTNTQRLTTKYDVRQTMLAISSQEKKLDFKYDGYHGSVLFKRQIEKDRTCREMRISKFFCSCVDFSVINLEEYYYPKGVDINYMELSKLLKTLGFDAVEYINHLLFSKVHKAKLCQTLSFNYITNASGLLIGQREYIKLEVSVHEDPIVRFEAMYEIRESRIHTSPYDNLSTQIFYRGNKRSFRIMYINRVDSYLGPCEEFSTSLGLPSQYCICKKDFLS
jgi:hypothetical protein